MKMPFSLLAQTNDTICKIKTQMEFLSNKKYNQTGFSINQNLGYKLQLELKNIWAVHAYSCMYIIGYFKILHKQIDISDAFNMSKSMESFECLTPFFGIGPCQISFFFEMASIM